MLAVINRGGTYSGGSQRVANVISVELETLAGTMYSCGSKAVARPCRSSQSHTSGQSRNEEAEE